MSFARFLDWPSSLVAAATFDYRRVVVPVGNPASAFAQQLDPFDPVVDDEALLAGGPSYACVVAVGVVVYSVGSAVPSSDSVSRDS